MDGENLKEVEKDKIPVWKKINLSINEAAEYSHIGINKLRDMVDDPCCPFAFFVGKKRLIKRKEFEKFLEKKTEI